MRVMVPCVCLLELVCVRVQPDACVWVVRGGGGACGVRAVGRAPPAPCRVLTCWRVNSRCFILINALPDFAGVRSGNHPQDTKTATMITPVLLISSPKQFAA